MHSTTLPLTTFVDQLQASGRYTFERKEALTTLAMSEVGFRRAAKRLIQRHRLALAHHDFYVIVPLEYQSTEAPPPPWFLDKLMHALHRNYYVGLLSAAALYGAAHQQPQEFQIFTENTLRKTQIGRVRLRFFTKRNLAQTPTRNIKTPTGYMKVSTPEATALDLIRYGHGIGGLGPAATVLSELSEQMTPIGLTDAIQVDVETTVVQRLGYLLDFLGYSTLAQPLQDWLSHHHHRLWPLVSGQPIEGKPKNSRWHVIINAEIEVDL